MILHYEDRHARQSVGLEGPDLLGQRRREISTRAENITRDSIQDFDSVQFHIASHSHSGKYHVVDLCRPTCDCEDFPRILFYKHIAGIYLHFPHLNPEEKRSALIYAPESTQQPPPQRFLGGGESLQTLSQDVFSLSQALTSRQGDPNPAVIEAFRSAKYSLTTAIASLDGRSTLPEMDIIASNQRSWPEIAERMGAKKVPRPRCLPNERGLTERSLGAIKGKRKRLYNDPYAGGERSDKRAKRDALSQAGNARVPAPYTPPVPFPDAPPVPLSPLSAFPSRALHAPHVPSTFLPPLQTGQNSLQYN